MQSREKWILFGSLAGMFLLAQVLVTQHMIIASLKAQLATSAIAQRVSNDQIADMTYQLLQRAQECDRSNTQQFVAGVVTALENRKEFTAIWHDGYDRGAATERLAAEVDANKTAAYTETSDRQ
jgi:hypothetical protein